MPDKKDPRPTKTASPKAKDSAKFADPTSKGELTTGGSGTSKAVGSGSAKPLKGKKAKGGGSLNVDGSDAMRQLMNITQGARDEIPVPADDAEIDWFADDDLVTPTAVPEPDVPENLPARTSMDPTIHDAGEGGDDPVLDIHWHEVKELPGYHIEQVRAAFRPLLNSLMGNQLEDLRMAATTDGSTSLTSMKQAIGYIEHNGTRVDDAEIDMPGIEGYEVERAIVYHLDDRVYIVAKETYKGQTNYYIYEGEQKNGIDHQRDHNAPRLN